MERRIRTLLVLTACLLVAGSLVFTAACGGSEETTTTMAAVTETTATASDGAVAGGIEVGGAAATPKTLSPADLAAMTATTIAAEHPKKGATEYTGVLFSELMTALGVQAGAATVTLAASDGFMAEIPLADLDANALLAFDDDGTYDAVMPGMEGKSSVGDIVSMQFK